MTGSAPCSMPGYKQRLRDLGMLTGAQKRQRWSLLTPRVGVAPEDDCAVLVGGVAQDLVQLNGEAVQVTNVKWAKVTVESIVQERLVNAKVDGREHLVCWGCRAAMGARRPLGRRLGLLGVREWGRRIRGIRVRGQVETVLDVLRGAGISIWANGALF